MATVSATSPSEWTVADLLTQLGDVPPNRIRLAPPPGTATEDDLLFLLNHQNHICELVDGILVEKTMGYGESRLASILIVFLGSFVLKNKLGIVLGEAGTLRILPDQVRIPDVSFISWDKFPGGKLPKTQVPEVSPNLAVEILSPNNSAGEMERKLHDYFTAGVELVWYIDPATRTAKAYTSPEQCETLNETQILFGGNVLPGFELPLKDLFAEAEGQNQE